VPQWNQKFFARFFSKKRYLRSSKMALPPNFLDELRARTSIARFLGEPPRFTAAAIEQALDNLKVNNQHAPAPRPQMPSIQVVPHTPVVERRVG